MERIIQAVSYTHLDVYKRQLALRRIYKPLQRILLAGDITLRPIRGIFPALFAFQIHLHVFLRRPGEIGRGIVVRTGPIDSHVVVARIPAADIDTESEGRDVYKRQV